MWSHFTILFWFSFSGLWHQGFVLIFRRFEAFYTSHCLTCVKNVDFTLYIPVYTQIHSNTIDSLMHDNTRNVYCTTCYVESNQQQQISSVTAYLLSYQLRKLSNFYFFTHARALPPSLSLLCFVVFSLLLLHISTQRISCFLFRARIFMLKNFIWSKHKKHKHLIQYKTIWKR